MMRTLLVRGMLAGLIAGAVATVFAYFFGEPQVNAAIALEEAHAHTHGEQPAVTRDMQSTLGLFTGIAGYAVAFGGLFAIAFAFIQGRMTTARPRASAASLAACGYVVVVLVPFLKYPANPPAVGSAATIGGRTALYFGFLALSIALAAAAAYLTQKLSGRIGSWQGGLVGGGGYLLAMALCAALLPPIDEVTAEFPASTLWTFRVASLGTQLVLWVALGLAFGMLVERVTRATRPAPAQPAV